MIRRTKEYILENKMIKNHSTVLVALSGGADSVCLLLVLNEIKRQCANELDFALEAVHVEHGIRGAESREDARFASDLCERLNIPCHVHSVDVPQYAKSHGLGLEEAARILRYEAFEKEVARILRVILELLAIRTVADLLAVKLAECDHGRDCERNSLVRRPEELIKISAIIIMNCFRIILSEPMQLGTGHICARIHEERRLPSAL